MQQLVTNNLQFNLHERLNNTRCLLKYFPREIGRKQTGEKGARRRGKNYSNKETLERERERRQQR